MLCRPSCGPFCSYAEPAHPVGQAGETQWPEQVESTGQGWPGEELGQGQVAMATLLTSHSRGGLQAGGKQQPVGPQAELTHA